MPPYILYALIFIGSYLFASVPWAFIIGKTHGIDIRKHGSGNVGATNVSRVLGKKLGILCFILDFLKGFIPACSVKVMIAKGIVSAHPDAVIIAAFAAISGHIWTIFLKFKGGKGMATGAGVLLAISPLSFVFSGAVWCMVFYMTGYVSLASITAAGVLPVISHFFSKTGIFPLSVSMRVFLLVISLVAIFKHRSNIRRLLEGAEHRFERRKK